MPINYIEASGADIAEIVGKIEDVVEGYPNIHVSMACIIVAALAQNPETPPDKLQDCVKGVSEYLAATLFNESPTGAVN